jgi:peptide subunit release factor RF-3
LLKESDKATLLFFLFFSYFPITIGDYFNGIIHTRQDKKRQSARGDSSKKRPLHQETDQDIEAEAKERVDIQCYQQYQAPKIRSAIKNKENQKKKKIKYHIPPIMGW